MATLKELYESALAADALIRQGLNEKFDISDELGGRMALISQKRDDLAEAKYVAEVRLRLAQECDKPTAAWQAVLDEIAVLDAALSKEYDEAAAAQVALGLTDKDAAFLWCPRPVKEKDEELPDVPVEHNNGVLPPMKKTARVKREKTPLEKPMPPELEAYFDSHAPGAIQ